MQFKKIKTPDEVFGKPLVPKRTLVVPAKKVAAKGIAPSSLMFYLQWRGEGDYLHLSPVELPGSELRRLERALLSAFNSLHRVESDLPFMPAIASWLAANSTHWSLARNLLVHVRHCLHMRKMPLTESYLFLLQSVDAPEGMRGDNYPANNEQAIRQAAASAGWLRVGKAPRVITPETAKLQKPAHVFKRIS
jgi:hypothetical protein